jgi:hypothetical protein
MKYMAKSLTISSPPALGNLQLAKLAPVHIQIAYNGWANRRAP